MSVSCVLNLCTSLSILNDIPYLMITHLFFLSATFSHLQIMSELAEVVYAALDYNLPEDEQCQMSQELEHLFDFMTADGKLWGRQSRKKEKVVKVKRSGKLMI